ncbi:MAG: helix-turn-helix transcriptional regulator [Desulfovibrionaceae bacterium]|nr:helix-turn-helix transcriptional regulator [Desulfovibrionaceae bacterium]
MASAWSEGGEMFREVPLRQGLALYLLHAGSLRPRRAGLDFSERVLRFSFVLAGSRATRLSGGETHRLRGGMMECGGAAGGRGLRMEFDAGPQSGVDVFMAPAVLAELLGESVATLPAGVRAFMAGEIDLLPGCVRGMRPEQLVAARCVHDVSLQGAERSLLLMSKTLELLSLLFASHRERAGEAGRLPEREIERLQCVRSRLVEDLESPPSIKELARFAGLNDTKLKRDFKGFFGQTVYGYFRSYRMERARELLERGEANISEAAVSVGYSNISHFSAAFSKHYGIKPSQFLRSVRGADAGVGAGA